MATATGKGVRRIARTGAGVKWVASPSWSADGSRIVFSAPEGLYSVKPDGSDRRRLTTTPKGRPDLTPAWQSKGGPAPQDPPAKG